MSIEDNKNNKEGNLEQQEPIKVEAEKSFESVEQLLRQTVEQSVEDLKKEDGDVEKIEQSVKVTNPDAVKEIKSELNLEKKLEDLNNQAESLKDKTEQYAEWLKLEDHKFDEESFYRIVDEKGYKDFQENNIIRSSPTGTDPKMHGRFDLGSRPTPFPSFDKGAPNLTYARTDSDNYIFESKIPMFQRGDTNPVTGFSVKSGHWAYRPIDLETGKVITKMTPEMIENIYKVDKEGNLYLKNKD